MAKHAYITAALLISIALAACENGVDKLPPEEQHRQAQRLPLKERYALYMNVYKSRTPSNPILADDIVELGAPARAYTVHRAITGDVVEFQAALAVLSAFRNGCTDREDAALQTKAKELASDDALERALLGNVAVVCRGKAPAVWR